MTIEKMLTEQVLAAVKACYGVELTEKDVQLQETRKEFKGDMTVVVFPFLRYSHKRPEETAEELGRYLKANVEAVKDYEVVKGFLNIEISSVYWMETLNSMAGRENLGVAGKPTGKTIMIEYSSPNTNKPLHLGHMRTNFLGWSVSQILKANGHKVIMANLVNDRGIHICKSMIAWKRYANGATPESTGMKGDHFVGDYYVRFDREYKAEVKDLMEKQGMDEEEAKRKAPILLEAQELLRKWEAGDEETVALWRTMNEWVMKGFEETYKKIGIHFDKVYFESQTYKKGRELVLKGLADGVLYRKESGSVWADLTGDGLDQKLLLRDDGTSVYMTQDLGTAYDRFKEFNLDEEIYVVGNEQNYHFQVLKLICKKLGFPWADKITHLSYGMIELPEGKMKSREGTVVDADDLIAEMIDTARAMSEELGKLEGYSKEEAEDVYRKVALGALKYFILKVDPKKTMLFNPKESIDFNGNTGPFIQYSYARIQSLMRKARERNPEVFVLDFHTPLTDKEEELIQMLGKYPDVVREAGETLSPALIANYAYELAKAFNQFYHDYPILRVEEENVFLTRMMIAQTCGTVLKEAMALLGIEMPERM